MGTFGEVGDNELRVYNSFSSRPNTTGIYRALENLYYETNRTNKQRISSYDRYERKHEQNKIRYDDED